MAKRVEVTAEQEKRLAHLEQVAEERRAMDRKYIAAILACRVSGATQAEIARRAGVSAEAIRQMVTRRDRD